MLLGQLVVVFDRSTEQVDVLDVPLTRCLDLFGACVRAPPSDVRLGFVRH